MYKHEIYKVDKPVQIPKIAVPDEFKEGVGKDSLDLTEVLSWPIVLSVEMRVNTKGDYTIQDHSNTPGISLINSETKYFKGGKYFYGANTNTEKALPISFQKMEGSKNILGFECELFIAINDSTNEKYEIWATKGLPQTITGLYRLPQFGYAVLQIVNLQGFWKSTATSVMPLKKEIDVFRSDLTDVIFPNKQMNR